MNSQEGIKKPSSLIDMDFIQGSLLVIISLAGASVRWIP